MEDEGLVVAHNLLDFLRSSVGPGQEAEIAIHPERREVLVFIDGELALSCSLDDLRRGPGVSLN